MLEGHLGAGHEIVSAEKMIQAELLKNDTERCVEKINGHIKQLSEYHSRIKSNFKAQKESLMNTTKGLIKEIQYQMQECLEKIDVTLEKERISVEQELDNLKSY